LTLFQLPILYVSLLAFCISSILNLVVIRLSKNYSTKNKKYEIRLSHKDIPPFGGLATSFSFFTATFLLGRADENFIVIGICAVIISTLGLIDDILNLDWKPKLFIQSLVILYPLITFNIFINIESFLNIDFNNSINIVFSLFWILIVMNSINFIDNMDGLTVIVTGSICLQIAFLAYYSEAYKITDITLILLSTLLGFLIYNFPPAKLYFGDSGTLFIGYMLGFISIIYDWQPSMDGILVSPFSPILFIFSVPVLDFIIVTTYRIRNKKSPTEGGTDHISHRLLNSGQSPTKVLFEFLLVSFTFYALLILTISFNGLISYLFALGYFIFFILNYLRYSKLNTLN